ncbi:DUF3307 domain-containing protein [Kitasatospora sp. MBT66]|uniref:DUF3307 domain-containing protein n=1 Tax=Kitasatospora sp. MBT66 TaxID=1444769 RepID=UPI0005BD55C1|nr:DUF3307 domain-containing protein [Kitasatospora sp. MBT66]
MISHPEAAVLAFVLLFVAHFAGDYLFQTDHMAKHKSECSRRGWRANSEHVAAHVASMFAVLVIARVALDFDTPALPTLAAVAWVAGTHSIIDRRWIIEWWMTKTGSPEFFAKGGAPLVDQAAHFVVGIFPAAVLIGALA